MSVLKRAHTWEISDSENESTENKAASLSVKLDDPDTNSVCVADKTISSPPDRSSAERTDEVKSPGRRRRRTREELQEDREKRKAAGEKRREEKERNKEHKLQEQEKRKKAAEKINLSKPENIIKSLTIHIHAGDSISI